MSTRSGKRIHSSFHESTIMKPDVGNVAQSERKTRSRRFKENVEELSILKTKKRSNYVSYPADEEVGTEAIDSKGEEAKPTRSLRKNVLKELNRTSLTKIADAPIEVLKPVKTTRRTRKFAEDAQDAPEELNNVEVVVGETKTKKHKKKKKSHSGEIVEEVSKKKSKKKGKKAKRSSSMVVEDIAPDYGKKNPLNRSNMSVDSFHSAAGSPLKYTDENVTSPSKSPVNDFKVTTLKITETDRPLGRQTRSVARRSLVNNKESTSDNIVKVSRKRKSSFKDLDTSGNRTVQNTELEELNTTLTNVSKKRKSSFRDTISTKNIDTSLNGEINTFDLEDLEKKESVVKAAINTTYDKLETPKSDTTFNKELDKNTAYDKEFIYTSTTNTPQPKLNSTYEKFDQKSPIAVISDVEEKLAINTSLEKDAPIVDTVTRKSAVINTTYEKDPDTQQDSKARRSSIINVTYEKDNVSIILSGPEYSNTNVKNSLQKLSTELNSTYDKTEIPDTNLEKDKNPDTTFEKVKNPDTTFEKDNNPDTTFEKEKNPNTTFEKDKNPTTTLDKNKKLDATFDKISKSSLISSDNSNITLDKSDISRISITSDDSKDNIINATPVLIESSLDESQINTSKHTKTDETPNLTKLKSPETQNVSPKTILLTPLKREGTFTKDGSDIVETQNIPKTPTRKMSLPSPGCTPFPNKSMMNITRSLEKSRRSSLAEPLPRATRVMFCSPENNPVVVEQQRRKVIKSNLKGSNKSFVFEDAGPQPRAAPRKRSYTHSDADDARAKRHRLADGAPVAAAGRRSRVRTTSATAKLPDPGTPSKKFTTTPKKSEKISRTKLPNFAALHQREFSKMESLDECQERKARRAKQLLTPTGAVTVLERSSPRDPNETNNPEESKISPQPQQDQTSKKRKDSKKPDTPIKSLPTLRSLNPGYTRFGFKLNYDVNPFNITSKETGQTVSNKKNTSKDFTRPLKEIRGLKRQTAGPVSTGGSSARDLAKQTVMREKSFTDKRNRTRTENRTVIKGVRTNRRFELQMRMRNID